MLRFGLSLIAPPRAARALSTAAAPASARLTSISASRFTSPAAALLRARPSSPFAVVPLKAVRFASTNPGKPAPEQFGKLHHEERFKETPQVQLSWNEFFQLRKRRRFAGTVASVFTALLASIAAFQYFANLVIDFNQLFMGIEMQWIYLAGIIFSGFLGWLAGPLVGNGLFNLTLGARGPLFSQMDNVFLRHVARNRPNPTKHNVNTNPLPDYYGEKISSLHDYRQWLREGRLFAKKAENFF